MQSRRSVFGKVWIGKHNRNDFRTGAFNLVDEMNASLQTLLESIRFGLSGCPCFSTNIFPGCSLSRSQAGCQNPIRGTGDIVQTGVVAEFD
jgi:hypothetical protein